MKKLAKAFVRMFLGAKSNEKIAGKGLTLALAAPAFGWLEWTMVGLAASLVAFLKHYGVSNLTIFFILWVGNVVITTIGVFASNKSGMDFTLMQGLRRLVDEAKRKSKSTVLLPKD